MFMGGVGFFYALSQLLVARPLMSWARARGERGAAHMLVGARPRAPPTPSRTPRRIFGVILSRTVLGG